jgi:hypothetical protein
MLPSVLYLFLESALGTVHKVLSYGRSAVIIIAIGLNPLDFLLIFKKKIMNN